MTGSVWYCITDKALTASRFLVLSLCLGDRLFITGGRAERRVSKECCDAGRSFRNGSDLANCAAGWADFQKTFSKKQGRRSDLDERKTSAMCGHGFRVCCVSSP